MDAPFLSKRKKSQIPKKSAKDIEQAGLSTSAKLTDEPEEYYVDQEILSQYSVGDDPFTVVSNNNDPDPEVLPHEGKVIVDRRIRVLGNIRCVDGEIKTDTLTTHTQDGELAINANTIITGTTTIQGSLTINGINISDSFSAINGAIDNINLVLLNNNLTA